MVSLNYLSNFWRTLEMSLIYCEINIIPTWSVNCIALPNNTANQATTHAITDTKLCVSVVALSTYDNPNLLQ